MLLDGVKVVFLYRIIYSYDGIGLDSDLIVVYNLKNDKVVDLIYLYGGENDYNFDYEDILNFNYNIFWRYNQRRIDKFLSDYNIIQNFSNKFYTNEYIDKYEIILKNRTSMCEEPDNGWEYGKEYEHEYRLLAIVIQDTKRSCNELTGLWLFINEFCRLL